MIPDLPVAKTCAARNGGDSLMKANGARPFGGRPFNRATPQRVEQSMIETHAHAYRRLMAAGARFEHHSTILRSAIAERTPGGKAS